MQQVSLLRCPHCGAESEERMPDDACRFFHDCVSCGMLLRPRTGDCCVFCSYGSAPCPPVQRKAPGCAPPASNPPP